VEFALFRNDGIAFSLPVPDIAFWPLALPVLAALIALWRTLRTKDAVGAALVVTVILGALSNIFDKALTGAVTDYLIFFGRSAVNIADGMIVGGVIALLLRKNEPAP
jgi:lipoprotein signal peptidase